MGEGKKKEVRARTKKVLKVSPWWGWPWVRGSFAGRARRPLCPRSVSRARRFSFSVAGPARRFSSIWRSSGASEAALNTIIKCRSLAMRQSLGSLYVVLATNLSSTVFAACSEFQTQRSPKRESSKRVSYAI